MQRSISLLAALLLLNLAACVADPDPDDDGLSTVFEESIGTNPELSDTDGDGFSDAREVLTYFSPRNENDFPYEGEYPRGPLMSGDDWDEYTDEAGWAEGEISRGWKLTDQHGEEIKLKRFFGSVVLVDLSSEWCGPCRISAETINEEYEDRREDGFIVIQLLLDGLGVGDATPDGDRWVEEFGLTFPLIEEGERHAVPHYVPPGSFGIPNYTVIGRDHRIASWYRAGGEPPWDDIDALLDEDRPEVSYALPENAEELYEELGLDPNSWTHPSSP